MTEAVWIIGDRTIQAAPSSVCPRRRRPARGTTADPIPSSVEADGIATWVAAVFAELGTRLNGMMLAKTRDPDLAAEVTQDAFLRLLREAQAGRYPQTTSAWLYRTATNLVISRSRRAAVAQRLAPLVPISDSNPLPEDIVLEREDWRAIGTALARLSPTERLVLMMAGQGLRGQQIADQIGRSHSATRSLMCRARSRLRQLLESASQPRVGSRRPTARGAFGPSTSSSTPRSRARPAPRAATDRRS
jgi:RNA polymerase sigma factor (sigma-70 family)